MKVTWLFKDRGGAMTIECTSFPYAFRTMWNALRKGMEKDGRKYEDMVKQMSIVSPVKNRDGDLKVYSFTEAKTMAEGLGLLSSDGQINSKEFRR